MHRLGAVWTGDVSARFRDLNSQIALEADAAGAVLARQQTEHVVGVVVLHVAQLAFL